VATTENNEKQTNMYDCTMDQELLTELLAGCICSSVRLAEDVCALIWWQHFSAWNDSMAAIL